MSAHMLVNGQKFVSLSRTCVLVCFLWGSFAQSSDLCKQALSSVAHSSATPYKQLTFEEMFIRTSMGLLQKNGYQLVSSSMPQGGQGRVLSMINPEGKRVAVKFNMGDFFSAPVKDAEIHKDLNEKFPGEFPTARKITLTGPPFDRQYEFLEVELITRERESNARALSLEEWLSSKLLDPDKNDAKSVEWMREYILGQLARKVRLMHEAGYVHVDLKPANILVTDYGKVHIIDFGLAERSDEIRDVLPNGTLPYVPYRVYSHINGLNPGESRSLPADDVHALRYIAYELRLGRDVGSSSLRGQHTALFRRADDNTAGSRPRFVPNFLRSIEEPSMSASERLVALAEWCRCTKTVDDWWNLRLAAKRADSVYVFMKNELAPRLIAMQEGGKNSNLEEATAEVLGSKLMIEYMDDMFSASELEKMAVSAFNFYENSHFKKAEVRLYRKRPNGTETPQPFIESDKVKVGTPKQPIYPLHYHSQLHYEDFFRVITKLYREGAINKQVYDQTVVRYEKIKKQRERNSILSDVMGLVPNLNPFQGNAR